MSLSPIYNITGHDLIIVVRVLQFLPTSYPEDLPTLCPSGPYPNQTMTLTENVNFYDFILLNRYQKFRRHFTVLLFVYKTSLNTLPSLGHLIISRNGSSVNGLDRLNSDEVPDSPSLSSVSGPGFLYPRRLLYGGRSFRDGVTVPSSSFGRVG